MAFIDKNNALNKSLNAHARLARSAFERKEVPTYEYHCVVANSQIRNKKILSRKTRSKIYDRVMQKHKVY